MIVSLVKETCELIQEIEEREQAKSAIDSVNETLGSLTALNESVTQLQISIQVLNARLPLAEIIAAAEIGTRCAYQLKRSAEQFLVQPRQKNELQTIQNQLQRALEGLKKAWRSYASGRTREPDDLYRLVSQLPEVVARKALYDDLRNKLVAAQNTMPTTKKQLQDFDRTIEQFNQLLREIEGLNEDVKTFLLRASSGTASLADVTDEVLKWCHQGQRSKAFSVRFAH